MVMQFIKQADQLPVVLADALTTALGAHERVVWLVPGGSNIPISVAAMQLIDDTMTSRLTIMQTDERFVPPDSADCNWHQLQTAGFDTKQATCYPMLANWPLSLDEAARHYANIIETQFAAADYLIGQFGIGADGHTAGIKPGSSAVAADALVVGYQAADFTRLTLTPPAIARLDAAYVFAYGDDKQVALHKLQRGDEPLTAVPAGALSRVPICKVYNDQVEG